MEERTDLIIWLMPVPGVIGRKDPILQLSYLKEESYFLYLILGLDKWSHHFMFDDGMIVGSTDIGIGTVRLLDMNSIDLVLGRKELIKAGFFL